MACDPQDHACEEKLYDVVIIDGGDTVIETALALKDTNSVTISTSSMSGK